MIKEFKEFINQGNLVDMAIAFVLGTAFATVVDSFVNNILMQIVAMIVGKPDFSDLYVTINNAQIQYGAFLNAVIMFLIIGFAMFMVVKAYNAFKKDVDEEDEPDEVQLLTEIRDALKSRS